MLESPDGAELNPDQAPAEPSAGATGLPGRQNEPEPVASPMRAGYLRGQEVGTYVLVERLGGGAIG